MRDLKRILELMFKNHSKFLEPYPIFIPFYAIFRIIKKIFTSWRKWTSEIKKYPIY